jgi:hypothetical protein
LRNFIHLKIYTLIYTIDDNGPKNVGTSSGGHHDPDGDITDDPPMSIANTGPFGMPLLPKVNPPVPDSNDNPVRTRRANRYMSMTTGPEQIPGAEVVVATGGEGRKEQPKLRSRGIRMTGRMKTLAGN